MLWVGGLPVSVGERRLCQIVAVGITGIMFVLHAGSYARIGPYLGEYLALGSFVEPHRTILPLDISETLVDESGAPLSFEVAPVMHLAGRMAIDSDGINLKNYEARVGLFPLLFREGVDPYEHMGNIGGIPPRIRIAPFTQRTGLPVDYVILFRPVASERLDAILRDYEEQLAPTTSFGPSRRRAASRACTPGGG